jgi:hypothetical protein
MFGTPERITNADGDAVYRIPISYGSMGVTFELDVMSCICAAPERQPMFRTLQNTVLSELANQTRLFKTPPSLESLMRITPDWGFVSSGATYKLSPYTILKSSVEATKLPCMVDMRLVGIEMSRTTIRPIFQLTYAGPKSNTIDFEWSDQAPRHTDDPEIEEVSELPAAEETKDILLLSNPVVRAKERMEAKLQVRTAFLAAQEARNAAKEMAEKFYESYDLSDTESAFTEWESDSDESNDS